MKRCNLRNFYPNRAVLPKGFTYEIANNNYGLTVVTVDNKKLQIPIIVTFSVLERIVSQNKYVIHMRNVSRIQAAEVEDAIKIIKRCNKIL